MLHLSPTQRSAVNASFFVDGGDPSDPAAKTAQSRLSAMGFSNTPGEPVRSGGIRQPEIVTLPVGAVIIRFYNLGKDSDFGGWWSSPHELRTVFDYFGVSSAFLAQGRAGGANFADPKAQNRSVLNALLAVRAEWLKPADRSQQLGSYRVVRVTQPVLAWHGEAYETVIDGAKYSDFLKPMKITDRGAQRGVRQIFLPSPYKYRGAFGDLMKGDVGTGLRPLMQVIERIGPLPFER